MRTAYGRRQAAHVGVYATRIHAHCILCAMHICYMRRAPCCDLNGKDDARSTPDDAGSGGELKMPFRALPFSDVESHSHMLRVILTYRIRRSAFYILRC